MIQVLMSYKVYHQIIDAVANICSNDFTNLKLIEQDEVKINITNGMKQGWTLYRLNYNIQNNNRTGRKWSKIRK